MKKYIVYDDNGFILRSGSCTDETFDLQAQEGENVIEGEANDKYQMIKNRKVVDKPVKIQQEESIKNKFFGIKKFIRSIPIDSSEVDLNERLEQYFEGKVDINKFKKDNYDLFRKKFYPNYIEFVDANVKLSSEIESVRKEGEKQLGDYYSKCLEVKNRFPKGG
jgi:hypothetical protein